MGHFLYGIENEKCRQQFIIQSMLIEHNGSNNVHPGSAVLGAENRVYHSVYIFHFYDEDSWVLVSFAISFEIHLRS